MAKRLPKTTTRQYEELLDFVEQNKIVLCRKVTSLNASAVDKLWQEFAQRVNAKCLGSPKTARQWRHVFSEWKVNTKRKMKANGGEGSGVLSDLQKRLLGLISRHASTPVMDDVRTECASTKSETSTFTRSTPEQKVSQVIQLPLIKQDNSLHTGTYHESKQYKLKANYNSLSISEVEFIGLPPESDQQTEHATTNSDQDEACVSDEVYIETESNFPENPLGLEKMNAQALNNLASAINNLANAKKSEAEALHLLAKAKMLCAKAKYYKVCNKTLEEFEI